MGCNCKNEITNFLGGDVPNPTTFLDCGEADGTYNNPLETGKTQCIAIENVLRVLDTYIINGEVKNSGEIVFERTVTGATYVGLNIANADLSLDGNHTTDISTHTLTFDSGAADVLKLNGSSDAVVIGPSGADYSMPKNRGTNKYILETDGAGGTSWVASDSDAVGYWSATTGGHIANSGFTNVGIGTHVPSYALAISGTVGVDEYIYHDGDNDTFIRFRDDKIDIEAGGKSFISIEEKSSAPHEITFNADPDNVDIIFNGESSNPLMKLDASTNRVGIGGVGVPDYLLTVSGNAGFNEYLYHNGDPDTYIKFADDSINLFAGNKSALKYQASTGKIQINNSNGNIDLNVMGDDGSIILQTDATNNRVGINIVPIEALHVDGNVTVNNNINVSGNTNIIGRLSANTVSGDTVIVGPAATAYSLPRVRGTNRYILQTNGAGDTAWVASSNTNTDTSYFVERFQVYDEARTDGNYKYPVAMTATGRMAQVNVDYGVSTISATTTIPRATVLKAAYFVVPSSCTLEKIVGWGEFASSNTITIDIVKFTFTNDETSALGPTSIGQVTYVGGSDVQKSKVFATTGIGFELSQGDVLMPMVKANGLSSGSYELSAFFTLEFKYV